MKRSLSTLFGLALLVAGARTALADKDRYDVGEEVPTFTLKALDADLAGASYIGIDRYVGPEAKDPRKALLISFFATYCEPCKKEMPLLAALYDTYRAKGLQILLVSIDTEADKIETARTLARANGVAFPVLSDRFDIVAKRYYVAKLPNSYLVGSDGKVLMANVGYNGDISRRLVEEIRKALGEPTSDPIPDAIARHMAGAAGSPEAATVEAAGGTGTVEHATATGAGPAGSTAEAAVDHGAAAASGKRDTGSTTSDEQDHRRRKAKARNRAKRK